MQPRPGRVTHVARLTTDAGTAARIQNALAECCDGETVAIAIAREADERWSLALHFRDRPDEFAVRALIASAAGPAAGRELAQALARDLTFEELAPTDWVRKSLEGLAPVEAGRFVVHGAHARSHVGANRIAIQIEAGLAFGTGHHGSTRGCLLALDRILKREGCKRGGWAPGGNARPCRVGKIACRAPDWWARRGAILPTRIERGRALAHPTSGCTRARAARLIRKRKPAVLDIGTGSGVLAIAAAKVLHRRVIASDVDARAVATARDNARINGVASSVEVVHAAGVGDRRISARSPFALILANILLGPLKELATPVANLVAPNGRVVLSGLLNAQGAAAVASYRARGLALAQRIALGGWTTLILVRPSRRPARALRATRRLPRVGFVKNSTRSTGDARLRPCSKPASSHLKIQPSGPRAGRALRRCAPS